MADGPELTDVVMAQALIIGFVLGRLEKVEPGISAAIAADLEGFAKTSGIPPKIASILTTQSQGLRVTSGESPESILAENRRQLLRLIEGGKTDEPPQTD